MRKKQKEAAKEKTVKKTFLDRYYLPIACVLILIIIAGAIAFLTALKPSKTLPDNISNTEQPQNILVNKLLVNTELKPDTHIYYVMRKPANISGEFEIHAYLTSEESFNFYMFENKEDIKNSTAKPITTFLLMKTLDRTFPVEEGNVIVFVNNGDKNVNVEGSVEYLERQDK